MIVKRSVIALNALINKINTKTKINLLRENLYEFCCHCHGTFAGLYMYHINVISLEYKRMSQIMAQTNRERKFPGHFAPSSESSREREGTGSERAKERKFQGRSYLQGANWPGSEKAVNPVIVVLVM